LDADGFDEFCRRETPSVVGLLIKSGYGRDDALDATQYAMAEAFVKWNDLHFPGRWVRTVALHAAAKIARARNREHQSMTEGCWLTVGHDGVDRTAVVESRDGILVWLLTLPAQRRKVVALSMDEFTANEIAAILALKPATVRSHLRHVRNSLLENPDILNKITGIEV